MQSLDEREHSLRTLADQLLFKIEKSGERFRAFGNDIPIPKLFKKLDWRGTTMPASEKFGHKFCDQ